jgi:fumarate hydratase class II
VTWAWNGAPSLRSSTAASLLLHTIARGTESYNGVIPALRIASLIPDRCSRKTMTATRTERDSLGEIEVPADALYGAQTQRAVENFPISGRRLPRAMIESLGSIKRAFAVANGERGHLGPAVAAAIADAAGAVAGGAHDDQFPVDIFQTGSGTSSNMNANEVIATLATRALGRPVHPNDDVNLGQSSNDVFPSAVHVAACLQVGRRLLPALDRLQQTCERRAGELATVVKTGRTHLMDAMPLTLGQEIGAWAVQLGRSRTALCQATDELRLLALGGTAVGTGVNGDPRVAERAVALLSDWVLAASSALRGLASNLTKIVTDLRWMASGPNAGLAEIVLPPLQPGSSIMPGKVNPVIPEAVAMVCAEVIGNDAAISIAAQSGNFQLNVMWPLSAWNLLASIELLAAGCGVLAERTVDGFRVDEVRLAAAAARNPVLVTALAPRIGYDLAAQIAVRSQDEGIAVLDVAVDLTGIERSELELLLDPLRLTRPDIWS